MITKSVSDWENEIRQLIAEQNHDDAVRLKKAVDFACKAHFGATRKSTNEPYIVHPYEVCLVVSTVTDDVDVMIGALLHDVVEDTDYTQRDILERFGPRVAGFVADESEDKMEDIPKALSWMIRKEKFLAHLQKAPIESKTICLGDKVSNLRSTAMMYRQNGEEMWQVFNQKDPKRHAWYYKTIAEILSQNFANTQAYREYVSLYKEIFGGDIIFKVSLNGGLTMEIKEVNSIDNVVYVNISGRITSSNADDLYNGANEIIEAHPGCEMVYDLDGLEMISSAGLRVFLKLKKEKVAFKIVNANSDVYDVFEITGFVQMFDITKAFRKMSVDGCNVIGEGAKGIVYKIDDETIIKVYKDNDCMDDIINERECSKKALIMGVPTAIPFDIVRVGDKIGSVFELVSAKSVTGSILSEPDKTEEIVCEYADIMRDMHEVVDNGEFGIALPKIKDEVRGWVEFAKDYFPEETYRKMQKFADDMADCNNFLHGDGHPNNVMNTRDGMIFIDMDTLCVGDYRADLGVVYTALIGYKIADPGNRFIPTELSVTENIWKIFINSYCKNMSSDEIDEIEKWCKKFAYLRLFRRGIRKEKNPSFAQNAKRELEIAFGE